MSSRPDDFNKIMQNMKRGDLEDVLNVQQRVVQIAMGQSSFTHPNAPRTQSGIPYQPNQTELQFSQKSRSAQMSNFFRFILVGSLTPYLTLRCLAILQKRVIPQRRILIWSSMGTVVGGMYGASIGRLAASRDYVRLQDSPLAKESRYQLWQINPSHPFLSGFDQEMDEFENWQQRYDNSNSYNDEDYHAYNNRYDRNNELTVTSNNNYKNRKMRYVPPRPNSNPNQPRYQNDEDSDAMRRSKRDNFYKRRSGQSYDESDEVMDFFEQTQHGKDPKDDVNEFFQGDSKQKWG